MHSNRFPVQGMTCHHCGTISVPVQAFGCERCGSVGPQFVPTALAGTGRVLSAVTVNEHPNAALSTPLAIGVVVLDEGATVRARLELGCAAGDRVGACDDDGALIFRKNEEATS